MVVKVETISLFSDLERHLNTRSALSNACVTSGVPILKELLVVLAKKLLYYCDCDLALGKYHWMIKVV